MAAPPKPSEKVAGDYKIDMGPKTVEVEGICKLTEEEAICWKPDGHKSETLATELTNAIKSKADSYSNTFQFKFMKKNRILVLKTTSKPPKPGTSMSYNNGLLNDYMGGSEMREGWSQNSGIFSMANGSSFDQTQTERQVLTGAFNKETKTFPLRYQFTNSSMERKTIPFAKGQFTIDGNTYDILSISDKPDPSYQAYTGGMSPGAKQQKMTWLKVQAVKITNPNTILTLTPADDSGIPFAGLNDKGEPISADEMRKQQEADMKKMMEAQKAGKPYEGIRRGGTMMNNYIQAIMLDPSGYNGMGRPSGQFSSQVNVDAPKIKKLSVSISHRTVYVFDKIKLDAN